MGSRTVQRHSRIKFAVLVLAACLTCVFHPSDVQAQKGKRPPAKAKPKSKLPERESGPVVKVVGVDPEKRSQALASARTIDKLINDDLAKHQIKPHELTTDEQFVRRAYLTITGTIPMAAQAEAFCRRSVAEKRVALVDQLLGTPAHASHEYNCWADTLRLVDNAGGNNFLMPYQEWVKDVLRNNMPYDEFVREMMVAEGRVWENPAAGYSLRDSGMPLDNLNNTVRIFLGTQIGCAQCHNHPFDRWTQKEFYQLAAFTAGADSRKVTNRDLNQMMSQRTPKKTPQGGWFYGQVDFNSPDGRTARTLFQANRFNFGHNEKAQLRFPKEYAYDNAKPGDVAVPAVIFGKIPDMTGKNRREAFAEWLTSDENPRFARTIANRLWKQVFGRGVIEPVDDMKDDTVPANPELMAFLESEMKRLDYNLREFLRILYYTETFSRQATYDDIPPDEVYHFPGPVLRRMTAEQVWDSLLTVSLERPQYSFDFTRKFSDAVDLDEVTDIQSMLDHVHKYQEYQKEIRSEQKKASYKGQELLPASELRQPLPDGHFLRQYGQSNRELIDDSSTEGSVPQLLAMFNGSVTHMMLEEGSVIYNRVVSKKRVDEQIDAMFWSLLSRLPTKSERALALKEIQAHQAAGYGNVIWALLNTREFIFIQ
jgi:hypothetical protein